MMTLATILDPIREMAYPQGFSLDAMKEMPIDDYGRKIYYADTYLTSVGEGSSRKAYILDDKKVLKLATNVKGLAQNREEALFSKKQYAVCLRVFEYAPDFSYLITERADNFQDYSGDSFAMFSFYTGVDWGEVDANSGMITLEWLLEAIKNVNTIKEILPYVKNNFEPNMIRKMYDIMKSPWTANFCKFILENKQNLMIPGDFARLSTYGVVQRKSMETGKPEHSVIIIDNGFTQQVHQTHYARKKKPVTPVTPESKDSGSYYPPIKKKHVTGSKFP